MSYLLNTDFCIYVAIFVTDMMELCLYYHRYYLTRWLDIAQWPIFDCKWNISKPVRSCCMSVSCFTYFILRTKPYQAICEKSQLAIQCMTLYLGMGTDIWRLWCQKQVSQAGINIASHRILWDAITYPCMRYLLLAPKSSYRVHSKNHANVLESRRFGQMTCRYVDIFSRSSRGLLVFRFADV